MLTIGQFTITAARDGRVCEDRDLVYPGVEPSRWRRWEPLLLNGQLVFEIGSFVIRGPSRLVLVDLGYGPVSLPGKATGQLLRSLHSLGIAPTEVTDVIFTHLHFDHIGWATVQGRKTFPNAAHHCHADDWTHFMDGYKPDLEEALLPADMLPERKLAPLDGEMRLFRGDVELVPGIDVIETPGHSPGHVCLRVHSGGREAIVAGDIAHHQSELLERDWPGLGDADPALARQSRRKFAEAVADSGVMFNAAHFRDWQWGHVRHIGTEFEWCRVDGAA
jgi:glyoxylase-like metal-dependent hydrolase (beta-lactamase superfamily II)